jgi:hypothetical protein
MAFKKKKQGTRGRRQGTRKQLGGALNKPQTFDDLLGNDRFFVITYQTLLNMKNSKPDKEYADSQILKRAVERNFPANVLDDHDNYLNDVYQPLKNLEEVEVLLQKLLNDYDYYKKKKYKNGKEEEEDKENKKKTENFYKKYVSVSYWRNFINLDKIFIQPVNQTIRKQPLIIPSMIGKTKL